MYDATGDYKTEGRRLGKVTDSKIYQGTLVMDWGQWVGEKERKESSSSDCRALTLKNSKDNGVPATVCHSWLCAAGLSS